MARSAGSGGRKIADNASQIAAAAAAPGQDAEIRGSGGAATPGRGAAAPEAPAAAPSPEPSPTRSPAPSSVSAAPSPSAALPPPAADPSVPQQVLAGGDAARPVAPSGDAPEASPGGASPSAARKLAENIERIEALGQRLVAALAARPMPNPKIEVPGADLMMTAATAWMKALSEQPGRMIESQVAYWGQTLRNYADAQMALARGHVPEAEPEGSADRRFANPLWQSHPYFSFVRRQYLTNANALKAAAETLDLPDDVARRRIAWLTHQLVEMMAPTNFLATNPDALERAIESEGESLVRGLENLVRDVERNGGDIVVSLADQDAFSVGDNVGASEGVVVHRTPLYELIQYTPATPQVHRLPLLIFPPWINKFYILDLKPQNSLVRWLVGQGHTLFMVSWKNPDASHAETGLEHYVAAYLDAMDKVRELTAEPRLNTVGYCIGGTVLALTLALLRQRGDDRVNSATLFTTLTDFSDQGEFVSFLQDDFVAGIADEVRHHGILRARLMSRTMSFLRPNDLVWGPAIRSYMMGETPPAFDLLFWNGDSTNLPGRMTMQYLRGLCQQNAFAEGGFDLLGHTLHLSDVTVPLCAVACETDHIAPWKDSWRGVAQMGSADKTFILSESGHIAGIVNPPEKKKYGHYLGCRDFSRDHRAWKEASSFVEGSWWPRWGDWLAERSGPMLPARETGPALCPAPGNYVHERAG